MTIDYANTSFLVVDDEPDSIEIIEMVLQAQGATVVTANNGLDALTIFQQEFPQIVLTDLSMPEMDGWGLLKQIRESSNGSAVVIAVTAHAMEGDKQKVLSGGFDGYISKPLTMFTLLEDIERWLD